MTDLPAPFIERTRRLLGDDYPRFAEALESESPTSIRLNPSKSTPTGTIGDPVLWARHGFYLSSRPTFTFDPRLHAGAYYVQEAASMFLNRVIRQYVHEPVRYLDLCAAPGGKSTDAVASLPVGSLIVSNEVIPNRAHILAENIVKWGSPYCIVTRNEASAFGALEEYFDIIAADVPCSGEGMFRKDPAAITEWSAANVAHCAERQRAILTDVWNALRPGGLFIYSTCTYNTEENEEMIGFLRKKFGAIPLTVDIDPAWNITPALVGDLPAYRFMPHRTRGEGLFMAILRKPGEPGETRREALLSTAEKTEKRNKKNKTPRIAIPDEWRLLVANPDRYTFISDEEKIIAIPAEYTTDYKLLDRDLDLISGEAGENVFGAGLPVALERLDRLEQEYLELFLGRRVVTTETRRFRVTPAEGKLQQIVCRFSPDAGLLPANDLTGDIVLLQYEPQGMAVDEAGVRPTSSTIPYRIAALTRCSLIAAGQEQAAQVLPVFQFGRTIALQVPRNR